MEEFIIYNLKVAIVITALLFCYIFALKTVPFNVNRMLILTIVGLSFAIPLCSIKVTKTVLLQNATIDSVVLKNLQIGENIAQNHSTLWGCIVAIYCTGAAAVIAYTLLSHIEVRKIINQATIIANHKNIKICVAKKNIEPFSYFRKIVISQNDYCQSNVNAIIDHEKEHIKLYHSYDLLFINLCCAVLWFNPAIWIIKKELLEIHEFQADNAVIEKGHDMKQYQIMLVEKACKKYSFINTNKINNASLLNRINMMTKQKNWSTKKYLRLLILIPTIAISLAAFSKTETVFKQYETEKNEKIIPISISENGYVTVDLQNGKSKKFGTNYYSFQKYVQKQVEQNTNTKFLANIKADANTNMGIIKEITSSLFKAGVNTFSYYKK